MSVGLNRVTARKLKSVSGGGPGSGPPRRTRFVDKRSAARVVTVITAAGVRVRYSRRYTGAMDQLAGSHPIVANLVTEAFADDIAAVTSLTNAEAAPSPQERLDDVAIFLKSNAHLIERFCRNHVIVDLNNQARELLERYGADLGDWKGESQTREAEHVCDLLTIALRDALLRGRSRGRSRGTKVSPERAAAIPSTRGSVKAAARDLGVSASTIRRARKRSVA